MPILLSPDAAAALSQEHGTQTFHKEARKVLEAVIRGGQSVEFNEDGVAEHIPRWSTWKNYIAKHARGEDIVGGTALCA